MMLRNDQHFIIRLGLALLALAATAGLFELFARQAPYTPLALALLPGPIQQLRDAALVHALVALVAGWTLPAAWPSLAPQRFVRVLAAGHGLLFVALMYAAVTGRMAVQIWDPRPAAVVLTALRVVGHVVIVGAYFVWARRLWGFSAT
jgi:hypothetical protein